MPNNGQHNTDGPRVAANITLSADYVALAAGSFTPMIVNSVDGLVANDPFLDWFNAVVDETRAKSGSQSAKITLQQGEVYPTCGGGRSFGGRRNLPAIVPEGKRIWQRMFFYFPSSMSAGYCYTNDDTLPTLTALATNDDTVDVDDSGLSFGTPNMQAGDPVVIELDDASEHQTTISSVSGAGTGNATVVLNDPAPGPAGIGSNFYIYQIAEAKHCGFGSADGSGRTKWLVFAPDNGTGRLYLQLENENRSTNGFLGMNLRSEAGSALTRFGSQVIPQDQWFALQLEVMVSSDPNVGYMRCWIDDEFIGQLNAATITGGATGIEEWGLGNYFNGTPYTDGDPGTTADFWVDEIMVASDADGYGTPTDTDSAGRPYIAPTTLAGDV